VYRKGEASLVPLWRQVYAQLRESIESGALPAGALIPASRTLARELKVSRNTVEGALVRLAAEGLIARRVGSGTRVARLDQRKDESVKVARDGASE
jgi:GntR family transcriptional regulator/MocR family aminotransferase